MASKRKTSPEYTDLDAVEKLRQIERELRAMLSDETMKAYVRVAVYKDLSKVALEIDALTPKVVTSATDDPIEAIRLRAIK